MVHTTTMIVTFVVVVLFFGPKSGLSWLVKPLYRWLSPMTWHRWGWLLTSHPFRTTPMLPCLVHIPNNNMSSLNWPLLMNYSTGKAVIIDKPFLFCCHFWWRCWNVICLHRCTPYIFSCSFRIHHENFNRTKKISWKIQIDLSKRNRGSIYEWYNDKKYFEVVSGTS
jgi:hypothetical protein